jgi:hypothetical protein
VRNTLDAMPAQARRALARAELRKRGIKVDEVEDPLLDAAMSAFFSAVKASFDESIESGWPDSYTQSWIDQMEAKGDRYRASTIDKMIAMRRRLNSDSLTGADELLLAGIPGCSLSAVEILNICADLFEEHFSDIGREF